MNILCRRSIAGVIMILLIAVGILLGSGSSLNKLRSTAADAFVEGANKDGFGIVYDLNKNIILAKNLLTVAGRYLDGGDTKELESVIARLESAVSVSEKYDANAALTQCASQLSERLLQLDISESDRSYCRAIPMDMDENNRRMNRNAYNSIAMEVNKKLNTFPANILKVLTNNKDVELFEK